jgi:DNA-binding NarL/FixJ family response regulator
VRAIAPLSTVLENVYAPAETTEEWLTATQRALTAAFDGHLGVQLWTLHADSSSARLDAIAATGARDEETLRMSVRHADAAVVSTMRQKAFIHASRTLSLTSHPSRRAAEERGVGDVVNAVGWADVHRACAASFVIRAGEPAIARSVRTAITRLAAHLGAAYRLRLDERDADAVLTPEGAVLHAERDAIALRERLGASARAILRAKSERDPAAGLAFWTAMVDGRWTLVERIDTDGKRLLFARKNAPGARVRGALTERERTVVERASMGRPLSYIAYELGLAGSTVSETLARALGKLGIANRAELVEMRGAIVGQ